MNKVTKECRETLINSNMHKKRKNSKDKNTIFTHNFTRIYQQLVIKVFLSTFQPTHYNHILYTLFSSPSIANPLLVAKQSKNK